MVNLKSIKTQLIIFLCAFALYLSFRDKDTVFLFTTLIAVISAIGAESAFLFLRNKKITVTGSSIISGLIVGYVLSSGNPWWIFLLASLLAIISKHLIHFNPERIDPPNTLKEGSNRKHLFNPAAFGIFMAIILFSASTQWRGTYMWYILLPFGLYFISKTQKLEVLIGYGLTALGLFGIQAVMQKTPLLNIFGYFSYFYIFIMIIEPKTTPLKKRGKFIFGTSAAVLIFMLTELGVRFDAELCALLLLNLAVPLLNKL